MSGATSRTDARPAARVDVGCRVLHVDMDAFYASVEIRDRPELAGRPVIVGGTGGRGVVLSASYPARAHGVRSAMPMGQARRLCPHAVVVPPRHARYAAVSRELMAVFRAVTPLVEPLALDEAFLDVTGAVRRLGPPVAIAAAIRARIAAEHGLTCSVGVAPSKFIAKIASAQCKPDGLLVVPPDEVLGFLHPLPVSVLWGVGRRTEEALARLGLRTIGDIARTPTPVLRRVFGATVGERLAALADGRDDSPVVPGAVERSIGAEETFPRDVTDPQTIRRELLRLAERTARGVRERGRVARTVTVKLKLANFTTITRSRTLTEPTDVAWTIYRIAGSLYAAAGLDPHARVRLVGVRVSGLLPAEGSQPTLDERPSRWRDAEQAIDRIVARFGAAAIRPAALLGGDGPVDGR